ncbi:MAG: hypothetical protein QM831_02990 [Kofleriaceae bacterium]
MRALLILLVTGGTAMAENEISVGSNFRALHSSSANALSGDNLGGGGFGYAHTLGIEMPFGLTTWVDANAQFFGVDGTMFQSISTTTEAQLLTAGLHVSYHPWSWVGVNAGVGFGAEHVDLTLVDSMGNQSDDGNWGAVGRANVQVDLVGGKRAKFGIRGELGYLAAQAVQLTPKRDRSDGDSDTIYLPVMQASLGHLDLSGVYGGFTLFSQF